MKIYELIYIWEDNYNGYDLASTKLLKDYTEVEEEIKEFCKGAENNEGKLFERNWDYITYDFNNGFSTLHIIEHELCD